MIFTARDRVKENTKPLRKRRSAIITDDLARSMRVLRLLPLTCSLSVSHLLCSFLLHSQFTLIFIHLRCAPNSLLAPIVEERR